MNKRKLFLLIICFTLITISAGHVFSQNLISPELVKLLEENGEIIESNFDNAELKLVPDLYNAPRLRGDIEELDPSLIIEVLYMQDIPETLTENDSLDLFIYNTLRNISSMEGIEYWSNSKDKMRILFEESYRVEEFKSKDPAADKFVTSIPFFDRIICFQKDSTFGKNYYELEYEYSDSIVSLRYMNLDSMYYSIIKAVSKENLVMHFVIFRENEKLFVYSICAADVASLFGMKKKAQASFYERLKAIRTWFLEELQSKR